MSLYANDNADSETKQEIGGHEDIYIRTVVGVRRRTNRRKNLLSLIFHFHLFVNYLRAMLHCVYDAAWASHAEDTGTLTVSTQSYTEYARSRVAHV